MDILTFSKFCLLNLLPKAQWMEASRTFLIYETRSLYRFLRNMLFRSSTPTRSVNILRSPTIIEQLHSKKNRNVAGLPFEFCSTLLQKILWAWNSNFLPGGVLACAGINLLTDFRAIMTLMGSCGLLLESTCIRTNANIHEN